MTRGGGGACVVSGGGGGACVVTGGGGLVTGGGCTPEVRYVFTAFINGYLPCPQCCPEKSSRSMAQNITPRRAFFLTTLSILYIKLFGLSNPTQSLSL